MPLCAAGSQKLFFFPLLTAMRGGQPETVPTGFRHLPSARRYALNP